jgi:phosphoenolpyruvate carboxykinase (ATP)
MLTRARLIEESLKTGSAWLSSEGSLMVKTGAYTGRAVNDRFVAQGPETEKEINWGAQNKAAPETQIRSTIEAVKAYLRQKTVHTHKAFVGPFPVEVVTTSPYHALFASHMFRSVAAMGVLRSKQDEKTIRIVHAPELDPRSLGLGIQNSAYIAVDFARAEIAITGTFYAGEIKKSAFSAANYLIPKMGHLTMHASANCKEDGSESCVLFGLSGTGKTTLSATADRPLIGDDEIVWTEDGLWNLEGGCYAKLIKLSAQSEPEIYRAVNRFGALLENVAFNADTRVVDFDSDSLTENTRGSYPLNFLPNTYPLTQAAKHPKTIVFLTADAFGALPAVAQLNPDQAEYHFISGYTARVAGTEMGVKEPQAVFSACFGAPFMPLHPSVYSGLLRKKMTEHKTSVWLLNTGWTNGGYGKGPRFPISVSRTLLKAIQDGSLERGPMKTHPVFGFQVPTACPGVDAKYLDIPSGPQVQQIAQKFDDNIRKVATELRPEIVRNGGPRTVAGTSMSPTI